MALANLSFTTTSAQSQLRPDRSALIVSTATLPIRPERIELDGPTRDSVDVTSSSGWEFSNLEPGTYQIYLRFAGGVRVLGKSLVLGPSLKTSIDLPVDSYGGVLINIPDAYCFGGSGEINVDRVRARELRDEPVATGVLRCETLRIAGLEAGTYALLQQATIGPVLKIPRTTFTIRPQQWTQLSLTAPPVVVRGSYVNGGRPVARQSLSFVPLTPQLHGIAIRTDDAGNWAAGLETPGRYQVFRVGADRSEPLTIVDLMPGENFVELKSALGSIEMAADRSRPARGGSLYLDGENGTRIVNVADVRQEIHIDGLKAGKYGLWGTFGSLTTDRYRTIQVEAGTTNRQVLTLSSTPKRIVLAGASVKALSVELGGNRVWLKRLAENAFDATGLSVGVPAILRTDAGALICRKITSNSIQDFGVPAMDDVEVVFSTDEAARSAVLVSAAGSDCDIPMRSLNLRSRRRGKQIVRMPVGYAEIVIGQQRVSVRVPGPPVVVR